jgi:hypothetical protein
MAADSGKRHEIEPNSSISLAKLDYVVETNYPNLGILGSAYKPYGSYRRRGAPEIHVV